MDCERELGLWQDGKKANRRIEGKEALPFWLGFLYASLLGSWIALAGFGFMQALRVSHEPIVWPYPVYVSCQKAWDTALMWQGRCERAWTVLKDHHSGVNNGKAFAILDGQN